MFETKLGGSRDNQSNILDNSLGTTNGSHDPLAQDPSGTTAAGLKTAAPGEPLEEATMAKSVIHSYPWYIADWKNSDTRLDFSMAERALYRELLDHCYAEGSLPTDERKLAKIAACSDRDFRKLWPSVKGKFILKSNRYVHKRAEEIRKKVVAWHDQRREAGKAGGLAKAKAVAKADAIAPAKRTPQQPSSGRSSHPLPPPLPLPPEEPPTPLRPEPMPHPRKPVPLDETFAEFEQAYRDAKPDVIPEDFADALIPWRSLAFNQQLIAVSGIRRRVEFGRWRPEEPHFIPPPGKYLRSGDWKREVVAPPAAKRSARGLAIEKFMNEPEDSNAS